MCRTSSVFGMFHTTLGHCCLSCFWGTSLPFCLEVGAWQGSDWDHSCIFLVLCQTNVVCPHWGRLKNLLPAHSLKCRLLVLVSGGAYLKTDKVYLNIILETIRRKAYSPSQIYTVHYEKMSRVWHFLLFFLLLMLMVFSLGWRPELSDCGGRSVYGEFVREK